MSEVTIQRRLDREIAHSTRPGIEVSGVELGPQEYADLVGLILRTQVVKALHDKSIGNVRYRALPVYGSGEPGIRVITARSADD